MKKLFIFFTITIASFSCNNVPSNHEKEVFKKEEATAEEFIKEIKNDISKTKGNSLHENGVMLYVDKHNHYFIGEDTTRVKLEFLEEKLIHQLDSLELTTIILAADKASDWEYAVRVIDIAKNKELKLVIKTKQD